MNKIVQNQASVMLAIKHERDYQDRASQDGTRPDIRQEVSMGDLLGAIEVNVRRAHDAWYPEVAPYPKTMDCLRKIAALCVRAGEVFGMKTRNGLQPMIIDRERCKILPRRGMLARCSKGCIGIITSTDMVEVTYEDGSQGRAWFGVHLEGEKAGQEWCSRDPVVIGFMSENMG